MFEVSDEVEALFAKGCIYQVKAQWHRCKIAAVDEHDPVFPYRVESEDGWDAWVGPDDVREMQN